MIRAATREIQTSEAADNNMKTQILYLFFEKLMRNKSIIFCKEFNENRIYNLGSLVMRDVTTIFNDMKFCL